MKHSERLLNLIGDIEEKYIAESDPTLEVSKSFRDKLNEMIKRMQYSGYLRPAMTVLVVVILVSSVIWLGSRLPHMGRDESADMDAGTSTESTSQDSGSTDSSTSDSDSSDTGDMVEEETDEEVPEEMYTWYDRYLEMETFPTYYDVAIYTAQPTYEPATESITVVFENHLESELSFGQAFTLVEMVDDIWEALEMQQDEFTMEAILLEAGETVSMTYDLSRFTEVLDEGSYMLITSIEKAGVSYRVEVPFLVASSEAE